MFLKELNKKDAMAFVGLVENLAKVDQVYSEVEKDLIKDYIEELSLNTEARKEVSFDAAIKELEGSTERAKNIIYFELVGLALVDGSYEDKEIEFLKNVACLFNINKEKQVAYVDYFKRVTEVFDITVVDYEGKIKAMEAAAMDLLPK
jgi:uncharacterized tellurite resistance protein B-like protein